MLDRRRLIAAIAVLVLPVPRLAAAAAPLPAPVGAGVRIVDGWVLTDRDLDAIARLAR